MKSCRQMFGVWFALAVTALLSGCASRGAPLPPSLQLPKAPNDLRATRKGDKVFLTWDIPAQTTDWQSVRYLGPTRICRSLETVMSQCGNPVAEIPTAGTTADWRKRLQAGEKVHETYTDTLPPALQQDNPLGQVTHAVEVLNANGRGAGLSNQVHVPTTPTLAPPSDFKAEVSADGIMLTFTGMPDQHPLPEISHRHRIYRREVGSLRDTQIAEIPLQQTGEVRVVDHSFEWEKTYDYHVNVVSIVSQPGKPLVEVEGEDSAPVHVFAHDIYPPAVPTGLQAVFSSEGQERFIDLVWAPDSDADLAGYNVYRREESSQPGKINGELVKTPAYRDSNVEPGKKYFYSVSAVDVRGNESAHSEEASEEVPR